MKYRKKPIIIEAYQTKKEMDIETLEGIMHASVGDYIITGVNGEQYPCKPDIFEQTYDEVNEDENRVVQRTSKTEREGKDGVMDTIYREQAISEMHLAFGSKPAVHAQAVNVLNSLPSADAKVEEYKEILHAIADIISISPSVIQEDVFRYKMICDVMRKYEEAKEK